MAIKRKSAMKRKQQIDTLKRCEIIHHIEKGTFQRGWKTKKIFSTLEETLSSTKKLGSCNYKEVDKTVHDCFFLQRSQQIPIDGALIKEMTLF